jgi:hypothetical protein
MKKLLVPVLMLSLGLLAGCEDEEKNSVSTKSRTLFTIIDGTESYTNICFESTLNDWAPIPMYDDGTNGDVTAGDHIWSLLVDVTDSGEWGAIEDDGSAKGLWLIASTIGSNPSFTLNADGTVTGTTSYTIPAPGNKADILFTLTDETESLTKVKFKGSANGWTLVDMYDDGTHGDVTSGDHTWSVTLNLESGEWGAIEEDGSAFGQWLISGKNPSYSVSGDGTVSGTTSYTYSK